MCVKLTTVSVIICLIVGHVFVFDAVIHSAGAG